jgi:preprotein translocase subunit YajC
MCINLQFPFYILKKQQKRRKERKKERKETLGSCLIDGMI